MGFSDSSLPPRYYYDMQSMYQATNDAETATRDSEHPSATSPTNARCRTRVTKVDARSLRDHWQLLIVSDGQKEAYVTPLHTWVCDLLGTPPCKCHAILVAIGYWLLVTKFDSHMSKIAQARHS